MKKTRGQKLEEFDIKGVKVKATGEIIYRRSPGFPKGSGLQSAVKENSSYSMDELEEVNISARENKSFLEKREKEEGRNTLIRNEKEEMLEEMAIERLKKKGLLQEE